MKPHHSRHIQGLTLIEVLIAIVIIAVAFIALASSQITNLQVTRDAQQASLAMQAANQVLENVTQRILADYSTYQACPGANGCSGSETKGQFTVNHTINRNGADYTLKGLILVTVNATGPADVSLAHYVSCMEVSPPPTVRTPGVCS